MIMMIMMIQDEDEIESIIVNDSRSYYYYCLYGDAELRRHWLTPTMKYRFILCK